MNSSLPSRVNLGIPDNTTVTIVDTTGELLARSLCGGRYGALQMSMF